MDFNYLFTSFDGRINRAKWWAGVVIIALINIAIGLIVYQLFGLGFFGRLLSFIVALALFYPSYAVCAKRFQDRDKPAKFALYGLAATLVVSLLQALGLTGTPDQPNAIAWVCSVVSIGVGLWFLIELGILKGTAGSNRYGPDPLAGK
jgi:uncharacterized membrane protein YhaH (DUF805 family)